MKHFSPIRNDGGAAVSFEHLSPPWTRENFCQLVKMVPVTDTQELVFTWCLPSFDRLWRVKPLNLLGHLVGDEGQGRWLLFAENQAGPETS